MSTGQEAEPPRDPTLDATSAADWVALAPFPVYTLIKPAGLETDSGGASTGLHEEVLGIELEFFEAGTERLTARVRTEIPDETVPRSERLPRGALEDFLVADLEWKIPSDAFESERQRWSGVQGVAGSAAAHAPSSTTQLLVSGAAVEFEMVAFHDAWAASAEIGPLAVTVAGCIDPHEIALDLF